MEMPLNSVQYFMAVLDLIFESRSQSIVMQTCSFCGYFWSVTLTAWS